MDIMKHGLFCLLLLATVMAQTYDPETGKLIEKPDTLLFDPKTGELTQPKPPVPVPPSEVVPVVPDDNLAPAVPAGLALTIQDDNTILLTWDTSPDDDLDHFRIYRGIDPDSLLTEPYGLSEDAAFHDSDVEANVTYFFRVSAVDHNNNESEQSEALVGVVREIERTITISEEELRRIIREEIEKARASIPLRPTPKPDLRAPFEEALPTETALGTWYRAVPSNGREGIIKTKGGRMLRVRLYGYDKGVVIYKLMRSETEFKHSLRDISEIHLAEGQPVYSEKSEKQLKKLLADWSLQNILISCLGAFFVLVLFGG